MTIDLILAATKSSSSQLPLLIMLVLFGGAYFLFIRPRQQKQKAARQESKQVEVGDNIVTVGGVQGKVVAVSDEHVTIATGHYPGDEPGDDSTTNLTFVKQAIARKEPAPVPTGSDPAPEASDESSTPPVAGEDEKDEDGSA